MTPNRVGVYSADASYVSISSAQKCADICRKLESSFTCMSFDYCTSTQLCQLSQRRTPEGNMLNQSTLCDHYSSKPLPNIRWESSHLGCGVKILNSWVAFEFLTIIDIAFYFYFKA